MNAEAEVRERFPYATCERTVAAYVRGDGFRVYSADAGERWILGRGDTRDAAWQDAALFHGVPMEGRNLRKTRGSTHSAIKSAVGTTPRRATSQDMQGTVHTPKEFVPLLRPDGPYYGSGT